MRARKIIGNILIVLVVAFTAYLCVVMLRRIASVVLKDTYVEIFRYELIVCALFLLFALDVRFGFFTKPRPAVLRIAGWILRIAVTAAAAFLLFFIGKIAAGSFIDTSGPAKNAIVLGLALENGQPTDDLIARVDTAREYADKYPDASLVLTGGNADAGGRTEAAVMRDLLLARGVPEERMILEDKAESTKDNFRNTAGMIDPNEPVVLISSDYHMDRAVKTAKGAGFTDILRLPAKSSWTKFRVNVMWELILEINEML